MPKPTFEKPMPATYWASAIFSRAFSFAAPLPLTEARRFAAISSMALRWNMSVMSLAARVM